MKTKNTLPFLAVGVLFIALSLLLSFAPGVARGWGLNYIACFDPWVVGLFYLLLVCFCLPQSNHYCVAQITALSRKAVISTLRKHRYLLFAVLSIAAIGVFHLLQVKYFLLGDTTLRPNQIENGKWMTDPECLDEYCTMWTLSHSYGWLREHFNFTVIQTIRLVDDITGCLFVFFALCTANLLGNTFLKRVAAFVVSTLACTVLLQFCGYTEVYAISLLFLQAYLFTSLLCLKGKIHIIVPTLILLAGLAFHLMLVALLPSLIFLFYGKVLWKQPFFRHKITILGIVLLSLPFLYSAFTKYARPMMLGLTGDYSLFSIAHLKEFFNSQLLGGGIGSLIWLMILIYSVVFKVKYNLTAWFFLIASLSVTGLMFVFDAFRGSADWDLFAITALVCNLSNACFLLTWYDEKVCKNIKYGILMIAGVSICHTSMWVLTNRTDASISWAEKAYETDPVLSKSFKSKTTEIFLAEMFSYNKLDKLALKWYEKAYLKHQGDNAFVRYEYANELIKRNRKEEAMQILEQYLFFSSFEVRHYPLLIEHFIEIQNNDALYHLLEQMEGVYKQFPKLLTRKFPQEQLDGWLEMLGEFRKQTD